MKKRNSFWKKIITWLRQLTTFEKIIIIVILCCAALIPIDIVLFEVYPNSPLKYIFIVLTCISPIVLLIAEYLWEIY